MPILYTGTTLPISVSVGQTLVVKELTGTATVTGSSAAREDASSSIGAGFVVYGPQPSAVSLSMTTTGLCEWQIVNGDATPAKGALRVTLDPITGLDVLDEGSREVIDASLYKRTPRLKKLQSGIAKVMAGTGQCYIGMLGDSTTVGAGAGTGAKFLIGARSKSPTARLAAALVAAGIPASDDSWFGEHIIQAFQSVTREQYDSRFTVSAAASYHADGQYQSLGGIPFNLNSAGKAVNFTPTNTVDTVDIYSYNRVAGVFDVSFAGGASLGTVTNLVTPTIKKTTKTFTRGTGAVQAIWVSGNVDILGMVAYDSTTPRVNVMNWGTYGDKLTAANGYVNNVNEWRGGAALSVVAPDLVIVDMTINHEIADGLAGVSAYKAALTALCNDVVASGAGLVLATPHYVNNVAQTTGICDAYVAAIRDVALAFNAPISDVYRRLDDYATFNTQGMYADTLHLTAPGYAAKIQEVMRVINVWS